MGEGNVSQGYPSRTLLPEGLCSQGGLSPPSGPALLRAATPPRPCSRPQDEKARARLEHEARRAVEEAGRTKTAASSAAIVRRLARKRFQQVGAEEGLGFRASGFRICKQSLRLQPLMELDQRPTR